MRLTWFMIGAATASLIWALVVTRLGEQWIRAVLGG